MEYQKSRQLFEAIKKDDLKTFENLITSNADLNICFGRFPLLSVCYLFDSVKILNKFEKKLFSKSAFDVHEEFFEIYLRFKSHAKKSIRLFLDEEIVYPILMLAAIDDRNKIAKYYKYLYKNDKIIEKLTTIYKITNLEYIQATQNDFVAPKKKKSKNQKILLGVFAFVLCLIMVFPILSIHFVSNVFGIGTESNPVRVRNEKALVNAISNDFEYISLESNIILKENISFENFSGTLLGNEKTIYISENQSTSFFTNLTGGVCDINFVIVKQNLILENNFSFLAENLSGTIKNCKISGQLNVEIVSSGEVDFSLFVLTNSGQICDCTADVEIDCTNTTSHNAFLTSFAITNSGQIEDSVTTSKTYKTTTVDATGFVISNTGSILNCTNNLNIYQESAEQWHPNTAGFAIDNNGRISGSKNNGKISSVSTNENSSVEDENATFVLYAAGIVVNNDGVISNTDNTAEIYGNSVIANNYVAGIACRNLFSYIQNSFYITISSAGDISSCNNSGKITSISTGNNLEKVTNYAAGIASNNFTTIGSCNNTGDVVVNSNSTQVYAGGIVGGSFYVSSYSSGVAISITNSVSKSNITANTVDNYIAVGGIVGYADNVAISDSGFVGQIEINSSKAYVGGISGYIISNISYFGQSGSSLFNSYSSLKVIDNTIEEIEQEVEQEESETEEEQTTTLPTKYISSISGLIISNSTTLYFSSNKCVASEIPVMQYKFSTSNVINVVDIELSNTTVYDTLEEMLESLNSEVA